MWYDDPRFVGENPPPSDDDIDFDMDIYLEDVTWRYPRPQLVRVPNGIQIDWDLIHPSLLDSNYGQNSDTINENKTNEAGEGDVDACVDENAGDIMERSEKLNVSENEEILITASDQNKTNKKIHKKKKKERKETENLANLLAKDEHISTKKKKRKRHKRKKLNRDKSPIDSDESNFNVTDVEETENLSNELQKEEHVSTKKKKRKHHKKKKSSRDKSSIESDESNFNVTDVEPGNELISQSSPKKSKATARDPDCGKSKLHKHSRKGKYYRSTAISDDDLYSCSDISKKANYYSGNSKRVSSDDEQSLPLRYETSRHVSYKQKLRSPESKVKHEVFSDDESYTRKYQNLAKEDSSKSDDTIDCSSFKRSRGKTYVEEEEDDRRSENGNILKTEIKQDVQLEPKDCKDSKELHGSDVYYCSY